MVSLLQRFVKEVEKGLEKHEVICSQSLKEVLTGLALRLKSYSLVSFVSIYSQSLAVSLLRNLLSHNPSVCLPFSCQVSKWVVNVHCTSGGMEWIV